MNGDVRTRLEDERQQRLHRLLGSGGPAMPTALRVRLAAAAQPARPRWTAVARVAAPATAALAALALALVLVLGSGHGPTVADAARPSALAATAPAPARDEARPELLRAAFAGLRYPDWDRQFGWRAAGRRSDTVDGRATETVFYRHTHHRIGYTIVSGAPLPLPADAERIVVGGVELRAYMDGERDVVVFERGGHTCVLAGEVHRRSTLLKLASWHGDGAIAF
jgi:hypothetical protein